MNNLGSKINGRHKKSEKADVEKLIGKPFKCTECMYIEFHKHVEFGEEMICPKCGKGKLQEIILPI